MPAEERRGFTAKNPSISPRVICLCTPQGGQRIFGQGRGAITHIRPLNPFHITASVKNGNDFEWFRLGPIGDQIRVDREKFHIFVGQILPTVTGTGVPARKAIFSRMADSTRSAILRLVCLFDVTPDFDEIERSLRRKNVAHAHLGLAFQFRQVSIQLIFGDSFAAVELLDAAYDLCVDCFPVFQEPTILFFLGL